MKGFAGGVVMKQSGFGRVGFWPRLCIAGFGCGWIELGFGLNWLRLRGLN